MFCTKCGASVRDGAKFCRNCGAKLENVNLNQPMWTPPVQPASQEPVQPTPQPVMPQEPVQPTPEFVMPQEPVQPTPEFVMPQEPVQPTPQPVMPQEPVQPAPEFVMPQEPVQSAPEFVMPQEVASEPTRTVLTKKTERTGVDEPVMPESTLVEMPVEQEEQANFEMPQEQFQQENEGGQTTLLTPDMQLDNSYMNGQPVMLEPQTESVQKQPKKKGSKVAIIIEIIVIIILVIAIAIGGFLIYQNKTGGTVVTDIMEKFGKGEEESGEIVEGEEESEPAGENAVLAELQKLFDAQDYEGVVSQILEMDDTELAEAGDGVESLLQSAIDGHMTEAFSNVDTLLSEGKYADAFDAIDKEASYREELANNSLAAQYVSDTQGVEDKQQEVADKYTEYIVEQATSMANQGNTEEVQSIFYEADKYLSGDEYEDEKTKIYTKLVRSRLGTMQLNGEAPSTVLNYIDSNLELVDNDCWVLEFWDYFNALYEMENGISSNAGRVMHANGEGYLLPESDSKELSMADLAGFNETECRMARYEIYARHGRGFNDQAVTAYFSQYGWYQESVAPGDFDEFSLNEYEKYNRDLIIQYEKEQGFR